MSRTRCAMRENRASSPELPTWDVAAKRLRTLVPAGGLQKIRKAKHMLRTFAYKLPGLDEARSYFKAVTKIDPCAP